jgi:fructose-1,6-bisphosphatase/inositol monophosphatase family enzyme
MLEAIRRLHHRIRDQVLESCARQTPEELGRVESEGGCDTIYAIDRVGEQTLVEFLEAELTEPVLLIAEGIAGGSIVVPHGGSAPRWKLIVDPIDGTRGLISQKRSAWILTGLAPAGGSTLADIELAVQTEIPLLKQHLADAAWAERGKGVAAERWDLLTGQRRPLRLRPSTAEKLEQGFATLVRYFPGWGGLDPEWMRGSFEDQYISSGGQLYELMSGHDRFVADLRAFGQGPACRPYDLCTGLIAREAGVIVTDGRGDPIRARLNVEDRVSWAGYANASIRGLVEPLLQKELRNRGWH